MRLLQLTNKPPWPPRDGGSIAMYSLTKGLSMSGHDVTVLTMNTRKHHISPGEIPPAVSQMCDYRMTDVPASVSPVSLAINFLFSRLPYTASRFISRNFKKALADILQEKKFDVIQLEGLYLCPYIPLIRKHSKALIAYRAHNIENEIWARASDNEHGLKKIYLRSLARRIRKFEEQWINSYDLLLPITERDGRMLASLGNVKPMHVIPTGIDHDSLSHPAAKPDYNSIFHMGSLDWTPNQEGLIWFLKNCWPAIHDKNPDLRFFIAGRNAPAWLVEKLTGQGITYLGEVEDAYQFMASKGVMVVPLHSGSGMRIKIIEGMALGKAIVSTTIGAEGLGITHEENILIADQPEDFINSVRRLTEETPFMEQTGINAMQFIRENFDNLVLAEKLANFYQQNLH